MKSTCTSMSCWNASRDCHSEVLHLVPFDPHSAFPKFATFRRSEKRNGSHIHPASQRIVGCKCGGEQRWQDAGRTTSCRVPPRQGEPSFSNFVRGQGPRADKISLAPASGDTTIRLSSLRLLVDGAHLPHFTGVPDCPELRPSPYLGSEEQYSHLASAVGARRGSNRSNRRDPAGPGRPTAFDLTRRDCHFDRPLGSRECGRPDMMRHQQPCNSKSNPSIRGGMCFHMSDPDDRAYGEPTRSGCTGGLRCYPACGARHQGRHSALYRGWAPRSSGSCISGGANAEAKPSTHQASPPAAIRPSNRAIRREPLVLLHRNPST